jgi:hypothetical protein
MTVRQRRYGPDKLHKGPRDELPPVAQEWRRLCHRLWKLRSKMKRDPVNASWPAWREQGLEIIKRQQQLTPVMRAAGFRVHSRRGTVPEESLSAKRLRESLDSEARAKTQCDPFASFEGWEVFIGDDDS